MMPFFCLVFAWSGLEQSTNGQVHLNGKLVSGTQKDIGFISQEGDLLTWCPVLANVSLGLEIATYWLGACCLF